VVSRAARLAAALALAGCVHAHKLEAPAQPRVERQHGATGIPVAMSPDALMRPGAAERLQRALRAQGLLDPKARLSGLDDATRAALRSFQMKRGLPATGLPSYSTVRALGLRVDEVFVHGPRSGRTASAPATTRP
jgi:hypothetical protein